MEKRDQLRIDAYEALRQETKRTARILALKAELSTLKAEATNAASSNQTMLVQYAQCSCLCLTQAIMTTLPRELRDMIYTHLSTRTNELIEREHFRTTLDPLTRLYSYDHVRWKAAHYGDHFWDIGYVGKTFYSELIENYYHTSTFVFGDDVGVMSQFLATDEMKIGILPKDLVRNVKVKIRAVSCERTSFQAYMFGAPTKKESIDGVIGELEVLEPGARVRIVYSTDARGEVEREKHCAKAIEAVFEGGWREKLMGHQVELVIDRDHRHTLEDILAKRGKEMHI